MKKGKTERIELVDWIDSTSYGRWRSREDYKKAIPASVQSVGYVINDTRQSLTLIQSRGKGNYDELLDAIVIPKGCIQKRKIIKVVAH